MATDPNLRLPLAPTGNLPQAAAKAAATQRLAAPPSAPALPAPTISVDSAGTAVTNNQANDMSAQQRATAARNASLGLTPDVQRAQAARTLSAPPSTPTAPVVATAPASPLANATTSLGAGGVAPPAAAAPTAPNFTTSPGAAGTEAINPDVSRATRVAPAASPNWSTTGAADALAAPAAQQNAATRAGAALRGTGEVVSRATRFGAQPVATTQGIVGPRTAPGQGAAGAALIAPVAIASAAESGARPTTNYAERFGVDEAAPAPGAGARGWLYDKLGAGTATREGVENLAKFGRDAALRLGGAVTDLGAALPDTAIGMANATGLTDIRPIASMFNDRAGDYKPNYATDLGGAAVRPSAVSEQGQAQNRQWGTDNLRKQLAERDVPSVPAAPSPAPPESLRPDRAASATTKSWPDGAREAMNSTAPGTAVINGRVVSPDEIQALENRNVMSSTMSPGVAYSMATGGKTLELGQGPTRARATPAGMRLSEPTYSGGVGGPPTAEQARSKQVKDLVGDAQTALGRGKRRTARELISLLRTVGDINNGEAQARVAGAPRPQSAVEEALTAAQAGRQMADTELAQAQSKQVQRAAEIQQALLVETDPAKRKQLEGALAAMNGARVAPSSRASERLKIPIGSGLDAREFELPYDPETNQLRIPEGMAAFLQPPTPEKKK